MNDISIILDGIKLDAENEIKAIKAESEKEIISLREESEKKCALEKNRIEKELELEKERIISGGEASAVGAYRRKLLEIKSSLINDKIKKFFHWLDNISDEEYFSMLASLCGAYTEKGKATVYLSERDSKKNVGIFAEKLKAQSGKKCEFTLSDTVRNDIKSGCIVSYGSIEENLSWESLIEAKREDIFDVLAKELYGETK